MLTSGVLIDGRYRADEVLGRGGMAEVLRATDTLTGRPVAVKLLRGVDAGHARRFRAEIEVLGRLDDPGVVRLCGSGWHDGVPYLVLDLVDGPSLATELAGGPLGVDRSIEIGRQLAEALAHAHRLKVVHRDVKPANVLFDRVGRVRLADFGIARLADATRITATGAVVGTAPYLAPEQVEGRSVGPAADVYALGLVVLECLAGVRAYPGHPVEAAMARLHRQPDIPAHVPSWLRDVLTAMTARHPGRRPTADAVADAFRTRSPDPVLAPTGEASPAGEPTMVQPAGASTAARRRPPGAGATAVLPVPHHTATAPASTADPGRWWRLGALRWRAVAAVAGATLALVVLLWFASNDPGATDPPVTTATTIVASVPTTQPPPADDQGNDERPGKGKGRGGGNGNGRGSAAGD